MSGQVRGPIDMYLTVPLMAEHTLGDNWQQQQQQKSLFV